MAPWEDSGTVSFVASDSTTRPLPGQQRLPREFIAFHQRARIVAALAEETSAKGYREVTIADVVKRAGIARNTFYENFSSKEECLLSAQEQAMASAFGRVDEAVRSAGDWPGQIRAGLSAFVAYIGEEPALARTCFVEALAAGPAAVERYEESRQAFVSLFQLGRDVSPYGADLPETLEEAVVGGIFWIVYQRLAGASPEKTSELLPELVEFALTPYVGAEAARDTAVGEGEIG